MERQKIRLTEEKETLLVPLLGKALQSKGPHPILSDPKAEEILGLIDYDFDALHVPGKTLLTLAMRARSSSTRTYVITCGGRPTRSYCTWVAGWTAAYSASDSSAEPGTTSTIPTSSSCAATSTTRPAATT